MMQNNSERIRAFLKKWRYATTDLLKKGAFGSSEICPVVFKSTMFRLRKRRELFTTRLGRISLHFDGSFRKRWQHLESLGTLERMEFVRWSGIQHHLSMLKVANALEEIHPQTKLWANVLSESYTSTLGVVDGTHQKHAPDLTLVSESSGRRSFCYVEVERSLKAEERYRTKWRAYEGDPKVQSCLYWVYDERIALSLAELMRSFFSRRLGFEGFSMGLVLEDEFKKAGADTEVKLFSLKKTGTTTMRDLLLSGQGGDL